MREITAMKDATSEFDTSPVIILRDYREMVVVLWMEPWDTVTVNYYIETFHPYLNSWYAIAQGSTLGGYTVVGPMWAPEVIRIRVEPGTPGQEFRWSAMIYAL